MDKELQRIKIAKACGWKNHDHPDCMALKTGWQIPEAWCMCPDGKLVFNHNRPDYVNDLNAMHEAIRSRINNEVNLVEFEYRLRSILAGDRPTPYVEGYELITATCEQLAEAFLRTLGLWEDGREG